MIYFLYGEDSYRAKKKLEEIIEGYKKVHKSGLNLIYIDAKEKEFDDFYASFKITPMFAEKKLVVLKNVFSIAKFSEGFLDNIKNLKEIKDIIIVFEEKMPDQRTNAFKTLQKSVKCQEFKYLEPALLKKWIFQEFEKRNVKISGEAVNLLASFVKNDLWRMSNEINKLSNYKNGSAVEKKDVELHVKPDIESDIFKTIDALAQKNKKQALSLLRHHIENGDNALYMLSMFAFQFKNLLILKQLAERGLPYQAIVKKSGLHPFVAQKTYYALNSFSFEELKKIYRKIFQIDFEVKTGKIDAELALDMFISYL